MWTMFLQQLGAPGTVRTALVVGTLINLYGQVLVPWLRGADVLGALGRSFEEAPVVALLSVALGFAFPWLVSAYAGARVRVETAGRQSPGTRRARGLHE